MNTNANRGFHIVFVAFAIKMCPDVDLILCLFERVVHFLRIFQHQNLERGQQYHKNFAYLLSNFKTNKPNADGIDLLVYKKVANVLT